MGRVWEGVVEEGGLRWRTDTLAIVWSVKKDDCGMSVLVHAWTRGFREAVLGKL